MIRHAKVVVVVKRFPVTSQTFVIDHVAGLVRLGISVTVLTSSRGSDEVIHEAFRNIDEGGRIVDWSEIGTARTLRFVLGFFLRHPIRSVRMVVRAGRLGAAEPNWRSLLRLALAIKMDDQTDIVHCQFADVGELVCTLRKYRLCGVPVVTTFHGHDFRRVLDTDGEAYAAVKKYGDLVLAISDYTRQGLIGVGYNASRILYHPVGVQVPALVHRAATAKQRPDRIRIVTIARLSREKGLEYALQGIAGLMDIQLLPSVEYLVIGDGPMRSDLEGLAARLGISDDVSFLGAMSHERTLSELDHADIFLLSSIAELLPVSLMEAMVRAVPVVATDVGAVSELVIQGESGWIAPPRDAQALTSALVQILRTPKESAIVGRAGRERVVERHDGEVLSRKLVEIYDALRAR